MEGQPERGEAMQQQLLEEFSYKPDKSDVPAGVSTKTLDYLRISVLTNKWNILDEREQHLIRRYFTTDVSLDDLTSDAKVTRQRVGDIIRRGITRMYKRMPEDIQAQYSLSDLQKLKEKKALANSDASINKRKRIGRQEWEDHRERILAAMKEERKERIQRKVHGDIQSHTHRSK